MLTNLPKIFDKHRICIICEGNEEYAYLSRLNDLKVWNEQYQDIKHKINDFHGIAYAANEVVMYGNPCTMQIITKHWTTENLKSPAKSVNASLIREYTGVDHYKGRADQIRLVMEAVTAENYTEMKQRVMALKDDDTVIGSSNFGRYLNWFESKDSGWIEKINTVLEESA